MVQEQFEVERLRSENERLRRALLRAGLDADVAAAERADSDAHQEADLAISRAETSVARGEARRARGAATSAASALATSQALVGALRTRDRRLAALIELDGRLRDLPDTAAIVQAGVEIMAQAVDASRAAYGIVDPDAEMVDIAPDWRAPGVSSIAGLYRFRDFGAFVDDLRRGETVVIDDTLADPRTSPSAPAFRAAGILSLINVPLIERGRLTAVAVVQRDAARTWTVDELAFVTAVADRLRTAIALREA